MSLSSRLVILSAAALLLLAPIDVRAQGAGALLRRGIKQYNVGQFKKSLRVLRRALRASRSSRQKGKIYLYLGLTHAVLGKQAQAKRLLDRALAHNPGLRLDPRRFKPSQVKMVDRARRQRRRRARNRRIKLRRRAVPPPRQPGVPQQPKAPSPPEPTAAPIPTAAPSPAAPPADPPRINPPVPVAPRPAMVPRPVKLYRPTSLGSGELIIRTDRPGCRVHLDGKIVGTTPFLGTVRAGERQVAVESHDGRRSWQAKVTVSSLGPTRISAVIPEAVLAPVPDQSKGRGGGARLAWTWITASLGFAAAGVGAGLMISAAQDYEEYQQTSDVQRFNELDGVVRQKRTGAYISFGVAGALSLVALVLHVTRPSPPPTRAAALPGRAPMLSFEF